MTFNPAKAVPDKISENIICHMESGCSNWLDVLTRGVMTMRVTAVTSEYPRVTVHRELEATIFSRAQASSKYCKMFWIERKLTFGVFTSTLLETRISRTDGGRMSGSQPRSNSRSPRASSSVAYVLVTTSLHPLSDSEAARQTMSDCCIDLTRIRLQSAIYFCLHRGSLPENTARWQAQPGGAHHRHESA